MSGNEASRFKTCRRFNERGHVHSLTFSCFQRQPFLFKDRTRQWLVDALDSVRRKLGFHIWAYVIMPEHCHVVLYPGRESYEMCKILAAIKIPVTRRAVAFLSREDPLSLSVMKDVQPNGRVAHRFWQRGGGFDRNFIEPTSVHATIEYIHNNPVRRGLAQSPVEWRWSSAAYFAGACTTCRCRSMRSPFRRCIQRRQWSIAFLPIVRDAFTTRRLLRAMLSRREASGKHAVVPLQSTHAYPG